MRREQPRCAFNRRHPCGWRSPPGEYTKNGSGNVSILAALAGGDLNSSTAVWEAGAFQSTPLLRAATSELLHPPGGSSVSTHTALARGVAKQKLAALAGYGFNPCRSCERRLPIDWIVCVPLAVSTHTALASGGQPIGLLSNLLGGFQSAPFFGRRLSERYARDGRGHISTHASPAGQMCIRDSF